MIHLNDLIVPVIPVLTGRKVGWEEFFHSALAPSPSLCPASLLSAFPLLYSAASSSRSQVHCNHIKAKH